MSRKYIVPPNQSRLFDVQDDDRVVYYVNGFPQTHEELLNYDPYVEGDANEQQFEVNLLGYQAETQNQYNQEQLEREQKSERTILITISDLEKWRRILTSIPQFRDLAVEQEKDIESIEFLGDVVNQADFLSLPVFDLDMAMFDLLPKDNPEERSRLFRNALAVLDQIARTGKFPSRKYISFIFNDMTESDQERMYMLVKRLWSMLRAWGGMQIHYFEQTVRDWMYFVFEHRGTATEDEICSILRKRYPCKSDFEIIMLTRLISNAIAFRPTFDEFYSEFIDNFLPSFTPVSNSFLTDNEIMQLWLSNALKNRLGATYNKWQQRIDNASMDEESQLDSFFGIQGRLTDLARKSVIPAELAQDGINETLIKMSFFFPEGHRTLIEARIDRFTNGGIFDWKTTRKEISEMNDFEKLQIVLQSIAVLNLYGSAGKNGEFAPMVNNDYRFFLVRATQNWIDPASLPDFFHIPEDAAAEYEYILQQISPEEVQRLLQGFNKVVSFLISNKKILSGLKNYLKDLDGLIKPPTLEPLPESQSESIIEVKQRPLVLAEA